MALLPLVALFPAWVLATFAPGFLLVRRLRLGPVEKLCLAAVSSLFLLYLACFGIFLLGLGRWAYFAVLVGLAVTAAVGAGDFARLCRLRAVRRSLAFLGILLLFGTLCQAMCRHYSGGLWSGDWHIHFQKVNVFLQGGSSDPFIIHNRMIERPGMMTLIGTFFLGLVGSRFDAFQLVFTWLNVLSVLPLVLLARRFARRADRYLWLVAALLVCLPTVWVNATYTWTKLLAGFYAMLGIALYLRSLQKQDHLRMLAAFACLAAGILVHLVALPYAFFTFAHYVLLAWRRRRGRGAELGAVLVCGAAVLFSWYGWVLARYGLHTLLASNATVQGHEAQTRFQLFMKIARNFVWNIFPHPLLWSSGAYVQANRLGYIRDYMFLIYQTNLPLLPGILTGLAAMVAAYQRLRSRGRANRAVYAAMAAGGLAVLSLVYVPGASEVMFELFPRWNLYAVAMLGGALLAGAVAMTFWSGAPRASTEVWYWRGLIVFLPVAGAIAIDVPCEYGIGHIFFHPWAMMAVTLVAVSLCRWPAWVRWLIAAGMVVDFALGVWIQFHLEERIFTILPDGKIDYGGLAMQAGLNWFDKQTRGLVFLGDLLAPVLPGLEALLVLAGLLAVGTVVWGCRARRR